MDYKKFFKNSKVKLSDRDFVAVKLGGLITAARLYSRLSQAELAKQIGTQQPSLARAERGEIVPSVEYLYKIAKALKTEFIFPKFGFMEERNQTAPAYFYVQDWRLVPNEVAAAQGSAELGYGSEYPRDALATKTKVVQ